jgi:dipeptidyl aminopeptidase/acylaminoacyl peptidase
MEDRIPGSGNVFSFDFQMLAGAGYGVLITNQRGSTGYGDDFATKIIGDWGNLDYKDLMSAVDYAVELGLADPDRLGVCGISGRWQPFLLDRGSNRSL